MPSYQLTNLDSRLAFLAIVYHLERPGSELEPDAKRMTEHGLREVAETLEPQLDQEPATIDLSTEQRGKLLNALGGGISELKAYPLMPFEGGRRHGAAPAFDDALGRLFPEVREDAEEAIQLAAHMLALRRRLDAAQ
jgi:hypothetical protein